ncbi:outer membrane protein [Legionella geestiana]|uniref:Outer membrane protein n=1 Tax=Legionella geestiana TaxID=45065 RepID=A0A0W0TNE8_9GAMM|nr:outer membrane protein transport protein [Legionella geestiana]KTC97098.1 outer membrane protein [Legionella geestiana]QBS11455.1 hypothetical protein E4T54_01120 [Legionella geestiana]STX53885.1 outer membrane protein [Legionella geestiana]
MRRPVFSGMLSVLTLPAFANAIQLFTGLNYANPAELFKVQESEFIIGSVGQNLNMKFRGNSINFNTFRYDEGRATTNQTDALPYGRFARRINQKLVLGVDVTEPYFSNLRWGNNSILRYITTQTVLRDVDISPRASVALSQSLFVGAGLNINLLRNNEINFAVPTGPLSYANLINKSSATKTGFNLGAYYVVNPTNFVGVSYFSPIKMNTTGPSILNGTNVFNNDYSSPLPLPATGVLSFTHFFSKTWLANLQMFYSDWSPLKTVDLINTAVGSDFIFQSKYRGSYAFIGVVRHQYTEKLGLSLIGVMDTNPVPSTLRSPALPSDNQYALAISSDYALTKQATLQFIYGHGVAKPRINLSAPTPAGERLQLTTGHINVNANVIDLRVKIAV